MDNYDDLIEDINTIHAEYYQPCLYCGFPTYGYLCTNKKCTEAV